MASAVKYIANVGKSVKYATIDVLKEMNPVVTDMIETNQDVAKVTYSSIKNFKTLSAKAMKSLSQSQVGELAKDYKKNLLEDIKNGTFYNKKRQEQVENDIGNSDAWNIDESEFFANESDSFDNEVSSDEFLADSIDDTAERATSAVSQVLARTSEYQVEATRQSTNRILAQTSAMSAQLHSDLGILNANVSGLMKFNTEAMATHIENSRSFYERQQQQMDEQTSILKEMLEFQKAIFTPKTKSMSSKVNVSDIFTSTGAINLAEYFKLIKQNAENADSLGMGSMLTEFLNSGMGKSMAANPLGEVMNAMVRNFIPKIVKNTFEEFNDTISGSIATAIMNASKARNSTNPIISTIGNIFGIDTSNTRKIDPSNYNKGITSWTGKDHKALTEVIPTLLNKIYSSISGTKETRYDYDEGRFVSLKSIKTKYDRSKNRYVQEANDTILPYLENMISQMKFSSTERQKEFVSHLESILKENFKRGEYFNPNNKSINAKTYGLKGDHAEYDVQLIKRLISKIPKSKQLLNNTNFFQARESFQNWLSSIEDSGDSIFMQLFNGSKKSKSSKTPIFSTSEKLDETNSILRDIRDLLQNRRGRVKRSKKFIKNKNVTNNTITTSVGKKSKNEENEYLSDLGMYIGSNDDAKFNVDEDDIDSFDYIDPDTVDNKTYIKRLKEATTATKKLSVFLSGTSELAKQPLRFVSNVLKKTDERMYTLLFGSDKDKKHSILGKISDGFDIWFDDLRDIARSKLEDIKDWLTEKSIGDKAHGILSKLLGIDTKEWFKDFRKAAFGNENISMGEGVRKIFSEGFKEMWTGFKNFFKEDETLKDAKESVAGKTTKKEKERKKANKSLYNIGKALNKAAANHGNNDTGEGETSPVEEVTSTGSKSKKKDRGARRRNKTKKAADGLRKVSKTGVIAVSEGEMIVPPDMNPYNIKKREKAEQIAIDKFEKAYGKFGDIAAFARGGSVDIDPKRKKELDKQVSKIDKDIAGGKVDPKSIIKSLTGFSLEDQEYIMNHINDNSYATLHRNYKAARIIYRAKSLGRDAYEKGKENIGYKMMDSAKDLVNDARENELIDSLISKISQSINKNKDTTVEGKEVVNDIMSNFSSYLPRIAAGGVTGLALSAMLGLAGGPLLGAAVGSSLGLLSNSKKLQKWLFGEKLVDDEGNETIKGGILGEDLKKNIHKYFPNMSKGAIVGGIASILPFVPGGPMAGILVGSAVGFAKSNDKLSKQLFGEDKVLGKMKKTIEKKLPRMGLGAAAMFLGGPFGITTNLMVGAGLGFVSDTDKFKDIVFGTKGSNGERTGGLVQYIKESIEVPIDTAKQIWKETHDWFKDTFLPPLSKAAAPIGRQFKNIGNWFKDALTQGIKDHITRPIGRAITDNIVQPFQKVTGFILRQLLRPGRWAIGKVSQGVGAIGSTLRSHQLRNIGTASGLASERLAEMDQLDANKKTPFRKFANSKGYRSASLISSLSDEQVLEMQAFNDYLQTAGSAITSRKVKKAKTAYAKHIVKANDDMLFNDLKQLADKRIITAKIYSDLETAILNADIKTAMTLYKNIQINDSKNFTSKDKKSLGRRIQTAVKNAKRARDDADKAKEKYKQLKDKYGDIGLGTARFGRDLQQEVEGRGINDKSEGSDTKTTDSVVDISKTQKENHVQLMDTLNNISDLLEVIAFPESKRALRKKRLKESIDAKKKEKEEKQLETTTTLEDIKTLAEEGMTSEANSIANGKPVKVSKIKNIVRKLTNNVRKTLGKPKTVITENGPIKTRFDNRGNEIPDNTDSETKETLAKVEDKNQVQKGILSKLSGLGDTIKGFLGIGNNEDEEKEGIFSKILKGALKYGLPILGGLAGVGLVSKIANKKIDVQARDANGNKMFDENGNPIMTQMTIADAVKDGASRMWLGDDLTGNTNGAWFHIKDFTRNTVIPLISTGYDLVMKKLPDLIATGAQVLAEHAPNVLAHIGIGLGKGLLSVLKGVLSKLPGIGGLFKDDKKDSDVPSSSSIESGKIISSNIKLNTMPAQSSGKKQTDTSSTQYKLQSMFDKYVSGGNSTTNNTTNSSTSSNIPSSYTSSNSSTNTSDWKKNITSSLLNSDSNIGNTKDIESSLAYQNAPSIIQKKAKNQLSKIWNNPILEDGTTVGQLCNDNETELLQYQDSAGVTHSITGADLLLFPEVASQVLGIDISLTDKEREEGSKELRNAAQSNTGNWKAFEIIASGGKYGKNTIMMGMKGANALAKGADKFAQVVNKSRLFGVAGKAAAGAGKLTRAVTAISSIPSFVMEQGRKVVSNYSASRRMGKSVAESINVAKHGVGLRTRRSLRNANKALQNWSIGKEGSMLNKMGNTVKKYGSKTLDALSDATKISGQDVSKATSKVSSALSKVISKSEKATNAVNKAGKLAGKALEVFNKLKTLLSKFLNNNQVVKAFKKVASSGKAKKKVAEKAIEQALNKFADKILEKCQKGLAKAAAKIIAKVSTKLAAYIGSGGLIAVGFIIVDFLKGMSNADVIMKVEKPTIAEKFISGLVNAFAETFFITLFVDTDDLVQASLNLVEEFVDLSDLRKRQDEAEQNLAEYNATHPVAITMDEYLSKDKISTKVKAAIGKVGSAIKNIFTGGSSEETDSTEVDVATQSTSTVDQVNAAEDAATEGSYIYDDESGNAIGYDENNDGNPETMYVPQGDSDTSEYDTSSLVNINFNTTGTENSQLTTVDQSQIATSGEGSVVSSENQTLINSTYNEINTAIPDMVRQIKTNLANYFGVNPSDLNRKTNIGMNTMKGDGPLQLFRRLGLMWSQINTRLNPFINNLPTTLFSGMKDLTKFLTNNVGLMGEEGDYTEEDQTSGTAGYTSTNKVTKTTTTTTSSDGTSTTTTTTSPSTTDKDTKSSSSSSSGKKSKSIVSKIASGVKNVIKGIGNFFGIGGSGSGVDDQSHIVETANSADSKNLFISQKYGKYANTPFTVSGDRNKETVEDAGCAPAVATMAINSAGFSAEPITMDQAIKNAIKYKKPNNGVTADYFVDEFDKHGLNTSFITSDSASMKDTIIRRLSSGAPIILMGKDDKNTSKSSSPFGPKTHYVVATGISDDKQTIYVNDPESNKPKIPYKASKLLNGVMIGIAPVIRNNRKNKQNSMVTKIKRLLSRFSASGKYGEDTIEYKVWTGLRAAGYSEITVAGTMGNIYAESGFDPSVVEHGNGIGFGLIQWSYGRRTAIENYAAEQGKDVNSTELQVEWLLKECDPNDSAFAWTNSSTSYDGKSWTYDEWKNATDIESAVRAFMFCFERPAGTSSLQKRIDAANEYYEEFTGTAVPDKQNSNDPDNTGESEANQSPLEKLLSAFNKLAQVYGLTGGDSSGSTEDTDTGSNSDTGYVDMGDIRGNVSSNKEYAEKQVELVKKMKSVEGQLQYSWGPGSKYPGPSRNPDDGYADCSSTVQWAYQKVLGVDPGSYTGAQETDEDTYTVTNTTADESKMQLGDIILKNGHVEMYYGDGRMIGHGGGKDGKTPGPTIKALGSTPPYNNIKRWVGFRDSEGSTTFDGATEGGAGTGLFVSQNNPSYANKTIGNRTVADAGCAPAVATMALSKLNKNYNMSKAIKDASKYQNSSGKVTADYFAEAFSKNGVRPSYIPGNDINKLKDAITNGNVVLLGKDSSNKTKSKSPFGPAGHYVLATGLSKDGKYVYINDPESKRANQKYPVDILNHTSIGISTLGNITSKLAGKIKDKLKLFAGSAKYKYLFSGDSRTVGIQLTLGDSHPETLFVAKAGIGYQWMKDHAWSQIKQNLDENPDMKVVFLYGVNDMININYYLKRYKELEGEYDKNRIWYVSVNPIKGQQLVTDDQIQEFNKKLKEHAGSRYIDTYSMLNKEGFGSPDGLHYDNDTNTKIYDFIINAINNGGSSTTTTTTTTTTETEVKEDPSPFDELASAFTDLAQAYGLSGDSGSSTTSSSTTKNNNSNNNNSKGSSFPKYVLSEAQKKLAAGVIAGETGGSDLVAAKQEASQMANLNEIQYGKDPTGDNLESTLKGGWYAKASLSKSPTDTTSKAVEDVLVNGKRTLPRYVTEHDMFPLDAAISGHWNNGKSEDRSQYKRNSTVISQNPSRFSSPANYKFYDFFGENRDGDVAGYYDQYYDQYKDDVAWSGAGSGISSDTKTTPAYSSYAKEVTKATTTNTAVTNNKSNNQSNVDKLVEIVIKLLAQVVDNTSSIKDIASLLVKLLDLKSSSNASDSSIASSAAKGAMQASQLALKALSESAKNTDSEEMLKLIQSVESIAMQ